MEHVVKRKIVAHSILQQKTQLQLDFQFMSLSLSTTGFPKEQYDHLPAVRVVPVEGEVVGEPGVDLVQAQLLPGSRCQSLASHHVRFRANRLKSIREATEYDNVDNNNNN